MSLFTSEPPFLTKRHDTSPFADALKIESSPGSGVFVPLDLTGCTVKFLVGTKEGEPLFGGAAVIDNAIGGLVSFHPTTSQMAFAGVLDAAFPLTLRAEWEITFASGVIQTVPAGNSYRKMIVGIDLESA